MKINMICAIGANNELGKDNDLIWKLKKDLSFFKEKTLNKTVVMGYNTYKSLPKKLENRKMIVINEQPVEGILTYPNYYEFIKNTNEEEIFIIGGASLYNFFIKICDTMYITEINDTCENADVYFPIFDKSKYNKTILGTETENNISYNFVKYDRITKKPQGKIILIEGTDCSGKESQTKLLINKLEKDNIYAHRMSFPNYDSPTGKIIGACLLGKEYLCNELFKEGITGWFKEGGANIDPLVAIDFYAADRRYNLPYMTRLLEQGINIILDRYVASNMAHRGGMILDKKKRIKMYETIITKEYILNELPKPDKTYILYMPYEAACEIRKKRQEPLDQVEKDEKYLRNGQNAYLELANLYNYDIIECTTKDRIKSIEEINEILYKKVHDDLI